MRHEMLSTFKDKNHVIKKHILLCFTTVSIHIQRSIHSQRSIIIYASQGLIGRMGLIGTELSFIFQEIEKNYRPLKPFLAKTCIILMFVSILRHLVSENVIFCILSKCRVR